MDDLIRTCRFIIWKLRQSINVAGVESFRIYLNIFPNSVEVELEWLDAEDLQQSLVRMFSIHDPYDQAEWVQSVVVDFMDYVEDDNRVNNPFEIEDGKFIFDSEGRCLYSMPEDAEKEPLELPYRPEAKPAEPDLDIPINIGEMGEMIRGAMPDEDYSGNSIPKVFFDKEVSILRALGYQVGESSHFTSSKDRQALLDDFIDIPLPSNLPEDYRENWGDPDTDRRVQKMINHIRAMASIFSRRKDKRSYQKAISEWKEDIEHLSQYLD